MPCVMAHVLDCTRTGGVLASPGCLPCQHVTRHQSGRWPSLTWSDNQSRRLCKECGGGYANDLVVVMQMTKLQKPGLMDLFRKIEFQQGNTALHLAAAGDHREVALLLVENECELDLPNFRMQTPLHVGVESGHLEVVQVLLAGGASLEAREKSGKSALQLAARGNHVAIVDMLIRAQRYYGVARAYLDMDVGYVDPELYLRKPAHPCAGPMREVLWRLATRQLRPNDWKLLAQHWNFAPEHVRAIEHEYTGPNSYREHGYRLLSIWLHGVRKDENVVKLLFEALVAIGRRQLAEQIRRRVNRAAVDKEKTCTPSPMMCAVS
ncbi:ankyrin repeat and death domain-containing protein 1A-like isoform X3 [Pomacea canaliculata]|uniref:ankyrin repeat and death domain-containing protein 1A-like isoform X3 n=1 Tax=Pomacea canaliculata TaxID=400727 RepID=UPI000D73E338|nr:ankyrin repeat and death domain-containing protein 1A-like isoform X3 [Pomacea canaliculata]